MAIATSKSKHVTLKLWNTLSVIVALALPGYGQLSKGNNNVKLSAISPTAGATGSSVVITGSGFGTAAESNTVYFTSGVKNTMITGTVIAAYSTSLSIKVPPGATKGKVFVQVGSSKSNSVQFKVVSNVPPSVYAGTDQAINLLSPAILSGNANDDGLPSNTLTVSWSQVSGPGTVTFGNSASLSTTATLPVEGT